MLRVVPVEDSVLEIGAGAGEARRQLGVDPPRQPARRLLAQRLGEDLQQSGELPFGHGLVQGDTHRSVPVVAQIEVPLVGAGQDEAGGAVRQPDPQSVEEDLVAQLGAQVPQAGRQGKSGGSGALRHRLQAPGTVVHGVHRRQDGGENLSGADVARGPLSSNVLLASLAGQPVGVVSGGVLRDPRDPPRDRALELGSCGQKGGMRPAEHEWHPQPLSGADRDVGSHLARRPKQGQCQEVGRHDQ